MINLTISGIVGKDAKELEHGCVFSIATTKKGYQKQDGTKTEDKTTWFSVFGTKKLAPYIKKGDRLTIYTDDIKTDVYEGKVNLSCYAISLEFGGKAQAQTNTQQPIQSEQPVQSHQNSMGTGDPNEDLPF